MQFVRVSCRVFSGSISRVSRTTSRPSLPLAPPLLSRLTRQYHVASLRQSFHTPSHSLHLSPLSHRMLSTNTTAGNAPSRGTLELYYDVVSPFSYLAHEVVTRYENIWDLDVVRKPVFLGGIMKATGNQPPGMLPARAMHMLKDLRRNGAFYNLTEKIQMPEQFPVNTLPTMRVLAALSLRAPEKVSSVSTELWLRYWCRGQGIVEAEEIVDACRAAGLSQSEAQSLLEASTTSEVKDILKANTDEVISRGAYGAPCIYITINADPKHPGSGLYFGSDRFPQMCHLCELEWRGPDPTKPLYSSKL
eukprot:GFYU01001917.1.p1 GENE.GFYU01001917.1~~GFYU01001917.1.p1  ORF type:complete len:305 (+),score=84.62 GFYU01001917.1:95-1009(+)